MSISETKSPSLLDASLPILTMILLLAGSVYLYGADSSSGANQIALILSSAVALLVGWKNGFSWRDIEMSVGSGVAKTFGAMLIILTVAALVGTWILSGTVPAMIYYGLMLINAKAFYFTACVLCAMTAICIGSSWSVAGTIGVGLMGISAGLGLSPAITAGAIISGAYFGDKMSPLSDTTNLAAGVTEVELFTHIRHMVWTTVPAFTIALVLYAIIGANSEIAVGANDISNRLEVIEDNFHIGPHLLLPLAVVLYFAVKRYPAFPTLLFAAVLGAVFAVVFQQDAIVKFAGNGDVPVLQNMVDGIWRVLFAGYEASTGDESIDNLLTRGGMSSGLNTIWLIMCAVTFGAILEHLGILRKIVLSLVAMAKTTSSMILVSVLTCFGINIIAADQYIGIVLPGQMYKLEFQQRRLAAKNLSRVLEDGATVTSVLIPWNTCGAFMAVTLGVATIDYAMFCFFNMLCPIISVAYGYLNFTIEALAEGGVVEA